MEFKCPQASRHPLNTIVFGTLLCAGLVALQYRPGQANADRKQYNPDEKFKRLRVGNESDPNVISHQYARQRSGDHAQGQRPEHAFLPGIAADTAGRSHHIVEEIGRRDTRCDKPQNAHLEW